MRFHSATKKGEKPNEKTGMSKFSVIDILMQSNQRKEQDSHSYIYIYIYKSCLHSIQEYILTTSDVTS